MISCAFGWVDMGSPDELIAQQAKIVFLRGSISEDYTPQRVECIDLVVADVARHVMESRLSGPREMPEAKLVRDAEQIAGWIVDRLADAVGIPARRIQRTVDIKRYGLDSVVAVQIATDLGDLLGAQLPASLLWDYPSIDAMVEAILNGDAEAAAANKAAERKAAKEAAEAEKAAAAAKGSSGSE